ncbi:MAG: radical SAM protein, partial [Ardenticatenaceae bacterium]
MNERLSSARRRVNTVIFGDDYRRVDGRCRMAPEWLVLVINNFCNLRCKMCDVGLGESASVFYAHLIGDDPRNMSLELLKTILRQAAHFSPKPKIGLAYTEPLIHKQSLEFCRAIVDRGFFCSITTNGFMLPRLAEALVEIGVHEITISIDGPEEVHDRIRGRKGSFRNLYQGIERLNEAREAQGRRLPVIRFSYTLTDENYTHMAEFCRQVEALRPASLNFSHLNFISEEMATAHNSRYNGNLAVTRSNLGEMELDKIDTGAMWQALLELKQYAQARPGFPSLTIVPDFPARAGLDVFYKQPLAFVGGRNCTDPWRMLMIRT